MPYINYKAVVKNIQIKKDGVVEIKLEGKTNELKDQFNSLSEMMDSKVAIEMESSVVNYNVTINADTNQPIIEYKVNQDGVVEEVKPTHEQLKADDELDLPKEEMKTKDEKKELDRDKVDEFIKLGLAPNYHDLPKDFAHVVKRRLEGESYLKLANELDMSSGKIVDLVDEYRKRVAPLADKYWEWKDDQENSYPPVESKKESQENNNSDDQEDEGADQEGAA